MAKKKRTRIKLADVPDHMVLVKSLKYGDHLRHKPTAEHTAKKKAVLARQHKRTGYLNRLAGQINRIMSLYGGIFKSKDFYHNALTAFRKEPLNNRFMLLRQLNAMEINPSYPSNDLAGCFATVTTMKNKLIVTLRLSSHPNPGEHKADCYYYDVIMATWSKTDKAPRHSHTYSDWIKLNESLDKYEFQFAKPAGTVHWLLCLRQRLGVSKIEVEAFVAESMHIAAVGTMDKKDEQLLGKRKKEEEEAKKPGVKKPVEKIERVGPKEKDWMARETRPKA